mgnify:CR=1 FL=1
MKNEGKASGWKIGCIRAGFSYIRMMYGFGWEKMAWCQQSSEDCRKRDDESRNLIIIIIFLQPWVCSQISRHKISFSIS